PVPAPIDNRQEYRRSPGAEYPPHKSIPNLAVEDSLQFPNKLNSKPVSRILGRTSIASLHCLAKLFQCPNPEHAHRARGAIHPHRHGIKRESFDVPQYDNVAVVGRQLRQRVGQLNFPLALHGTMAWSIPLSCEQRFQANRRLLQPSANFLQRNLSADVALP